jgi:hypothetical protein
MISKFNQKLNKDNKNKVKFKYLKNYTPFKFMNTVYIKISDNKIKDFSGNYFNSVTVLGRLEGFSPEELVIPIDLEITLEEKSFNSEEKRKIEDSPQSLILYNNWDLNKNN